MKNQSAHQAIGIPVSSVIYATGDLKGEAAERLSLMPASYGSSQFQKSRKHPLFHWMNKFKSNANSYAKGICDHVSLGSTVSQTVKGKLSLGMRVIQARGIGRIFRQIFSVKGENLLNAFQCYWSSTAGPIPARVPCKVIIPLSRTKRACQSENINKPSQKYIQIITEDDFEFWFMGFLCYERSFNFIKKQLH
ncbi:putative GEM-like protein 8 [Phalaenopsis equestris]|uniref:putative GEM-like protein 8 n=1 Tax=Phalaenopsis equestris TaxID=78828 RepID=UPI0009E37972|nr:putative GEM-like protein 8 [Phalaenopsis equestris]